MSVNHELALVDTNVLVYASYDQQEHHRASKQLLQKAQTGDISLSVTPQIIAEYFATITNRRRVTEPYSALEAIRAIKAMTANLVTLPIPIDITDRWFELVQESPVTGADVFDVQLVATMLANGVTCLYTFNTKDFEQFREVTALAP